MTIHAVILGATGYVSGELLRLLAGHPEFELAAAVSRSMHGKSIGSVFPHLDSHYAGRSFCTMPDFATSIADGDRVALFSAAPHAASAGLVKQALDIAAHRNIELHVVDSSADFRYTTAAAFAKVYDTQHEAPELLDDFLCALPEHEETISRAHVGHPGCFATAMLLASVPLVENRLIEGPLFISGVTGSTGSGRSPQPGTHHPERHSNLYAYKALGHRHVPEVENLLEKASGQRTSVHFVPHSGPFARGIYVTVQAALASNFSRDDVMHALQDRYQSAEFVRLVDDTPKLKNVVASNYAEIGAAVSSDSVVVMCAIDNLVKGAAGGAIQWMNRLWSLPQSCGLTSAPPAWT